VFLAAKQALHSPVLPSFLRKS
jgi:hypothetical protein